MFKNLLYKSSVGFSVIGTVILALSGCATQPNPCEEILEVKRQQQECERLRKIMNREEYPQQALTAKKRFEEACLNLRYYRDDYDTICKGDKKPIGNRQKN